MPWTPGERVLEQTLRRVDAAAREGMLEAAHGRARPDPELERICRQARAMARRNFPEPWARHPDRDRALAKRAALGWFRENQSRIMKVLGRLRSARDVNRLVGCLGHWEAAAAERLQPLNDIRAVADRRLARLREWARAPEHELEDEDDLIPPWELVTWRITVPPSGRGITKADRLRAQTLARRWGATGPIDVGHVTPHVFTRPGDVVRVRPQLRARNRAEGRAIARAAAARRASPGLGLPVRPR